MSVLDPFLANTCKYNRYHAPTSQNSSDIPQVPSKFKQVQTLFGQSPIVLGENPIPSAWFPSFLRLTQQKSSWSSKIHHSDSLSDHRDIYGIYGKHPAIPSHGPRFSPDPLHRGASSAAVKPMEGRNGSRLLAQVAQPVAASRQKPRWSVMAMPILPGTGKTQWNPKDSYHYLQIDS